MSLNNHARNLRTFLGTSRRDYRQVRFRPSASEGRNLLLLCGNFETIRHTNFPSAETSAIKEHPTRVPLDCQILFGLAFRDIPCCTGGKRSQPRFAFVRRAMTSPRGKPGSQHSGWVGRSVGGLHCAGFTRLPLSLASASIARDTASDLSDPK